jgi:YidC/Oxa1 family membrane protein insertase
VYLAVVLSLLVVVLYQMLVLKPYQDRARQAASQSGAAAPAAEPTDASGPTTSTLPSATPTPTAAPAGGLAAPSGGAPVVTIDTDLYSATITTRGARLMSFRLKRFRRTVAADSPELNLVESDAEVLPLTLQLGAEASDADLVYEASRDHVVVAGDDEQDVTFTAKRPDGSTIEKRVRVHGDRYLFAFEARMATRDAVGLVLTPVASESALGGNQPGVEKAVALDAGSNRTAEHALTDLAKQPVTLDAAWAGFSAQYFAALAMPADGAAKTVMGVADSVPVVRMDAPPADGRVAYDVFLGPKDPQVLDRLGHGLDRVIDFGWFWFIAQPLLALLQLLYRLTGNYGIAIIVLTAGVKIITLPLMQTSFRSMKAMQALQPEMQRLRDRYKDDSGELQKQMMELYKKNKVNPFAGCLPMVLQIPIFVGLYNALNHAIVLRHAPFVGWISDLSAPDRLMIAGTGVPVLTLLMGASMLIQQRMTPQQGDPAQQRMMMLMPLVFTYMFINFPSGLVLYWLVNNVLTIAQQGIMLRKRGS